MVRIVSVTKIELGASGSDKETLTNIKRVIPDRYPRRHTGQTVMNTVNPVSWLKPHKYPLFDIHCLGEVYEAIYHNGSGNVAYDSYTADNPEIPYFKFFLKDENGAEWTVSLTGAIIDAVLDGISDGEDMLTVILVSAKSRTPLTKT
jgi:hypothetical protein